MKRTVPSRLRFCVLAVLLAVLTACFPTGAYALDQTTEIVDFQMHPDFWAGFLPSYIAYKFGLDNLLQLIPDRQTEISLTLSTGIIPRTISQNPVNGDPLWIWRSNTAIEVPLNDGTDGSVLLDTRDLIEADYDTMSGGWSLKFGQGFGESVERGKDALEAWFSFDGHWERAMDPILQLDRTGYPFENGIFAYDVADKRAVPRYILSGTPDLRGDRQMLSMSFNLGFSYNMRYIATARMTGIDLQGTLTWAPGALSNSFSGNADYLRLWLYATCGYTLIEKLGDDGLINRSMVLEDDAEMRVLAGSLVPKFAETTRGQVWGLTPDNMSFFARNSLRLHYYGQQFMSGLCVPSVYLFVDIGYSGGFVNNTGRTIAGSFWTGSAGLNIDLQMFEVLHVYYELGYIFLPGNDVSKHGFSIPDRIKFLVKLAY